jgi:hypothetical protein
MPRQESYYDREAGIVYFRVARLGRHGWRHGWRRRYIDHTKECSWGLVDVAEGDAKEVVGFEIWRPKEMLPPEMLEALPEPTSPKWWNLRRRLHLYRHRIEWRLWRKRRREKWLRTPEGERWAASVATPQRWYRGLEAPPDDPVEREAYRREHPDVKFGKPDADET